MRVQPSELFRALGVPTRVRIIELLKSEGPISVTEIAEELGITPAAVSQHLKVLRHAGLVTRERKGYWVPYSIDETALEECCGSLMAVCTCECHGHREHGHTGDQGSTLARLERYREELRARLGEVEKRIAELKGADE
jgi:DNA-binding transcriptional ArsR family regulator